MTRRSPGCSSTGCGPTATASPPTATGAKRCASCWPSTCRERTRSCCSTSTSRRSTATRSSTPCSASALAPTAWSSPPCTALRKSSCAVSKRGRSTTWWSRVVRSNSRSARWWKRLECARFLSVAATSHDIGRVLRLLRDHHPAVQIAAATTLERLASPVLVTAALDRLPFLGPTVQAYYASVLKRARPAVLRHLQQLFRRLDDPRRSEE